MVRKGAGIAAVLALAAIGFAAPARSQNGALAPVTINSCAPVINADNQPTPAPLFGGLQLASTSSGIAIEFVNDASKTADLVNFAVNSGGQQFTIRDVGTFSPGISIKHTYRNGSGQAFVLPQFIAPRITCTVASVRFTDGTIWRPGQAAPAMPPPAASDAAPGASTLTASPPQLVIDATAESELFLVSSSKRVAAFRESDTCAGIAAIFVAATGESSATYSVKPVAAGRCTARITDEDGESLSYAIIVR